MCTADPTEVCIFNQSTDNVKYHDVGSFSGNYIYSIYKHHSLNRKNSNRKSH